MFARRKLEDPKPGDEEKREGMTVDEALDRVGLGRGQYFGMTVNLLLAISDSMQLVAVFYLVRALGHDWGTRPDVVAWLDGGLFFGAAVGVVVGGGVADSFGRKPVILWGAATLIATGMACAWSENFAQLLTLRTLLGFTLGFNDAASTAMTLEAVPSKYRGKAVLVVQGIGGAVGKILVAVLADALYDHAYNPAYERFGWRTFLFICALPCIPAFLLGLYVTNESPRWLAVHGRTEEASQLLHNLALRNGTADKFPKGTKILQPDVRGEGEDLQLSSLERLSKEPLLTMVILTSGAMVCANFVYFGLLFALPVYIEGAGYEARWTREQKNTILVIVAMAEAPAMWFGFGSIDWKDVGRSKTVVFSLIGAAACCLVFNFQALTPMLHSSGAIVATQFLARGFASASVITLKIYCAEIFPTLARAAAVAVAQSWARIGAALSPVVVGFLLVDWNQTDYGMWTKLQPMRVFMLFSIFAGVGAFLIHELGIEPLGSTLPDNETEALHRVQSGSSMGGNIKKMLSGSFDGLSGSEEGPEPRSPEKK